MRSHLTRADGLRTKTFGIVTPSYNQGEFLERAIVSVLEQKGPHVSYAVIDGGSTDNSVEIIKRYEKHLDYWCSEPDRGQSDAIVKGFGKIGGELRGWLNSDDEYVDGAFAKVARAFDREPSLVLVYGERVLIDESSAVLGWSRLKPFDPTTGGYTIASETAFWTHEAETRVGPINTELKFAMDLDFFIRLYKAGPSLKLPEYLGKFRSHADSKSSTIPEVGRQEAAELWHNLVGDNENWAIPAKRLWVRHAIAGLRHPRLLGLPYVRQKLSRP